MVKVPFPITIGIRDEHHKIKKTQHLVEALWWCGAGIAGDTRIFSPFPDHDLDYRININKIKKTQHLVESLWWCGPAIGGRHKDFQSFSRS